MTLNTIAQLLKNWRINPLGFSVVNLIALQRTAPEVFEPIMRRLRESGPATLRVPDELKETGKYQKAIAAGIDYAVERATIVGGRMIDLALVPTDAELHIKRKIVERNNRLLQAQEVVYGVLRSSYEKLQAASRASLEKRGALVKELNRRLAGLGNPYTLPKDFDAEMGAFFLTLVCNKAEGFSVGNVFVLNEEHANSSALLGLEKENEKDYLRLFNAMVKRTVYGRLPRGLHATPSLTEPLNWMENISARMQVLVGKGKSPEESYGENHEFTFVGGGELEECLTKTRDVMRKSPSFDFAFLYDMELMFADESNAVRYVQMIEPKLLQTFIQKVAQWGLVVLRDGYFGHEGVDKLSISRIPFMMDDVELIQNRLTFIQQGLRPRPTAHLSSKSKMEFYIKYDEPVEPR